MIYQNNYIWISVWPYTNARERSGVIALSPTANQVARQIYATRCHLSTDMQANKQIIADDVASTEHFI